MDVRALGPLVGIDRAGAPVDLGGRRQLMVLATLLVGVNEPVSVDRLTLGVWGDEPPARVRHTLQAYISELRKLVPGGIERQSEAYLLRLPAESFDVVRFEALVAAARSRVDREPVEAVDLVDEALGSWRGTPYDGLGDADHLLAERARLERLRSSAGLVHVQALDASGRHAAAAEAGLAWIREAPFDEGFVRSTAIALYRSGRQADALRSLRDLRSRLGDELGLDPSPETVAIEDRVLSHDAGLDQPVVVPTGGPITDVDPRDVLGLVHLVDIPLRPSTIAAALGVAEPAVVQAVERLAEGGEVVETRAGVLERENAGDTIGATRAMSLSGRLADALSGPDADPATVGRLLHRAGRSSEAAALLSVAARTAATPVEAVALGEMALEVGQPTEEDRGVLHFLLASHLREMGESVTAAEHARRASVLLDGVAQVDAMGFASVVADDLQRVSEAEMWAALGQSHALAVGAEAKAASLRTLQGRHLVRLGAGPEADHALGSGAGVIREIGGPKQRHHMMLNESWAAFDRGDLRRALVGFEALRDDAIVRGGPVAAAPHIAAWSRTAWAAGLGREAEEAVAEAEAVGEDHDLGSVRFIGALGRAEGGLAAVGALAREAVETADLLAEKFVPVWRNRTALLIARVETAEGNDARAKTAFDVARSLTPDGQDGRRLRCSIDAFDPVWSPDRPAVDRALASRWWGLAGRILVRLGDEDSALDALAIARAVGDPFLALDATAAGDLWDHPSASIAGRMVRQVTAPAWAESAWEARADVTRAVQIEDRAGEDARLVARFEALAG